MKALKAIVLATLFAAPISASAMCGGMQHETSTVSVCTGGQVFDETKQECVDVVG